MAPGSLGKRPDGLSPTGERIFEVLAQHTAFPWPVMMTQCQRLKLDPLTLSSTNLSRALVDNLATSVGRFTSPEKEARVRSELEKLLGNGPAAHVLRPR